MVADSFDGLDGSFASRLRQMINESGGRFWIFSGYRSIEDQTELWNNALAKYGSEDAARQWVAPPGKSNHNHGWAADLAWANDDAREWAHANAAKYGLTFPMDWEPWHIEPMEARGAAAPQAYTIPPTGQVPVADPQRRTDPAYHLQNIAGMLARGDALSPASQSGDPTLSAVQTLVKAAAPGQPQPAQPAQEVA